MSEKHLPGIGGAFSRLVFDGDDTAWVPERTCRIENTNGEWCCSCCGEAVGSDDPWCELFTNGNAVELWNYCSSCGAKVMKEKDGVRRSKVVNDD